MLIRLQILPERRLKKECIIFTSLDQKISKFNEKIATLCCNVIHFSGWVEEKNLKYYNECRDEIMKLSEKDSGKRKANFQEALDDIEDFIAKRAVSKMYISIFKQTFLNNLVFSNLFAYYTSCSN